MRDDTSEFGERMKAAVGAEQGMELTPVELRMVWDALRSEMDANDELRATANRLRATANRIGSALRAKGWQIHVNPATGMVDGIEPLLPGADSGTVN